MVKKWIKRIIKGFVALACIALIWRVIFAGSEVTLDEFIPTRATAESYSLNGDLKIMTNDVADEISEGGYFSAYCFFYSPETKEVQVTVRYNNSTLDKLGDVDFYLYTVDVSGEPNDAAADSIVDADGNVIKLHQGYPMSDVLSPLDEYTQTDEVLFYNYEKLVFEGVEVSEGTNVILRLCKAGETEELAVIVAHFAEQPLEVYELSGDEKDALATFGKK